MTPAPSLQSFLETHRQRYHTPPDALHVKDIASVFRVPISDVQRAIDRLWNTLPPAVADEPVRPSIAPVVRPAVTERPFERVLTALRARGCRILPKHDQRGREAKRATCPSHDDRNPSLVVTADGPNVLLHCFGGCPTARVVAALGLKLADLFSGPPQPPQMRRSRAPKVKPPAKPTLTPEERLARRRMLTAARTRRWRERRQDTGPVTLPNIRSVTCDAVTLGDAPNVLPVTSQDECISVSGDLDPLSMTREEDPTVMEISTSVCREISFDLEIHPFGDHDGDDDGVRT
jgi:hypothetical protein